MNSQRQAQHRLLIWFLAFLGILFLRYQYFHDVFTDLGAMSLNTDAYYRLHRIQTIVNQPGFFRFMYPLRDFNLNFPQSVDVAWPLGLDLLFAVPFKWIGISDPVRITFFSFLLIPLLIIPIVLASFSIIRRYADFTTAFLGGVLIGIMPVMVDHTSLGDIDHHALGTLIVLCVFVLLEKIRRQPASFKSWLPLSFLLGLAPSFDPHGWLSCSFISMLLLVEKDQQFILDVAKSILLAFLISMICLMPSDRFWTGYVSVSGFSWWSCLVLFATALFGFFLFQIKKQKLKTRNLILSVSACLIIGLLFVHQVPSVWNEFVGGLHWLLLKPGTIGQTFESISFVHLPVRQWNIFWFVLASPLIMLWFLYQRKYVSLVFYAILPVIFSLFQIRFIVVAGPFAVILFVLFLHDLATLSIGSRVRKTVYVVGVVLMTWCFYPSLNYIKVNTSALIHQYFFPVRDASKFINNYVLTNPGVRQDDFKPAVIAPWDFGHWVLFFSKLPVYAHPFQGESAAVVNQLLTSSDPTFFEDFQKRVPARFLMIEQSIPRYYSLTEYVGKPTDEYFEIFNSEGEPSKINEKKNIESLFYHRFLFNLGADSEHGFQDHWRLMYVSNYAAADIKTLPSLKVFERVRGVTVKFETKLQHLHLEGSLQDRTTRYRLEKPGRTSDSGFVEWQIPYGQYDQGGVFCDGSFVILDSHNRMVKKLPVITNEQVLSGETLFVR